MLATFYKRTPQLFLVQREQIVSVRQISKMARSLFLIYSVSFIQIGSAVRYYDCKFFLFDLLSCTYRATGRRKIVGGWMLEGRRAGEWCAWFYIKVTNLSALCFLVIPRTERESRVFWTVLEYSIWVPWGRQRNPWRRSIIFIVGYASDGKLVKQEQLTDQQHQEQHCGVRHVCVSVCMYGRYLFCIYSIYNEHKQAWLAWT